MLSGLGYYGLRLVLQGQTCFFREGLYWVLRRVLELALGEEGASHGTAEAGGLLLLRVFEWEMKYLSS